MKQILIFEAADGTRFDEPDKCNDYEALCSEVNRIMAPLSNPNISGAGFYQHLPNIAQHAASEFTALAVRKLAPERANEFWHPQGIIQRFVDDCSLKCLHRASGRIACIDLETGREYEQPCYRLQASMTLAECIQILTSLGYAISHNLTIEEHYLSSPEGADLGRFPTEQAAWESIEMDERLCFREVLPCLHSKGYGWAVAKGTDVDFFRCNAYNFDAQGEFEVAFRGDGPTVTASILTAYLNYLNRETA